MSVRALLLDADGVTQETHSDFRASLKALCSDESRADDFVAEVFAAERPCATGGDFAVALGAVLEAWGSSYSVDAALDCWERVEPNAAVLGFVAELRAHGTLVALATNQQNRRACLHAGDSALRRVFRRAADFVRVGARETQRRLLHGAWASTRLRRFS